MSTDENWVSLLQLSTLEQDEMKAVEKDGHRLVVFHLEDGSVYVTSNVCTHEFTLLSEGWFEGCEIECPLHAGRFDVRSGKALCSPLKDDLKTFPTKIDNGNVMILLSSDPKPSA